MRKLVLLSVAVATALLASVLFPRTAGADGGGTFNLGPGQYTIGFTHPTGTISVGGGTISARCTAGSTKGNATLLTPGCVTRVISCPASASSCSVIANIRESALRGPVWDDGQIQFTGGTFTSVVVLSPYNCPAAFSCGERILFNGLAPAETVQLSSFNIVDAPNYPTVFAQLSMTIH